MRKEGMITVQMTAEEAKQIGNAIEKVLFLLDDATDAAEDIFDMLLPIMVEINEEEEAAPKEAEDEDLSDCENCTLPCLANPRFHRNLENRERNNDERMEKGAAPDQNKELAMRKENLCAYEEELRERLKQLALSL